MRRWALDWRNAPCNMSNAREETSSSSSVMLARRVSSRSTKLRRIPLVRDFGVARYADTPNQVKVID